MTSDKLAGVHPSLVTIAYRMKRSMAELNFDITVTEGFRTVERQAELFAQGRTRPGPIVTNADGVKAKSNHQAQADGYGHAVDFCFLVASQASWDERMPWRLLGEMAKSQGCKWGGDWTGSLVDRPHIEWP